LSDGERATASEKTSAPARNNDGSNAVTALTQKAPSLPGSVLAAFG